jgi:hypothetical protein
MEAFGVDDSVLAVLAVGIGCAGLLKIKEAKKRKRRQWWTRPWLERRNEGIGRDVQTMLEKELVAVMDK